MKTRLFELEKSRDRLKILREDAKSSRENCKLLTKSNENLLKAICKSNESNEQLKVENAKLREEKRRMSQLPHRYDPVCSSSDSVEWKSAVDSSSVSPFEAIGDFGVILEPGTINAQAGKGAIPRRLTNEDTQRGREHDEQEQEMASTKGAHATTESLEHTSQDKLLNLNAEEYLDCKESNSCLVIRDGTSELYSPEEYSISSRTDLKEQCSQRELASDERYDREKDWQLQGAFLIQHGMHIVVNRCNLSTYYS